MKKTRKYILLVGLLSVLMLAGCEEEIAFKTTQDRESVNDTEIAAINEEIRKLEGVSSFNVSTVENGNSLYAVMLVGDKKEAKDLAVQAFNRMITETTGTVDLFVQDSEKKEPLIQAFKPKGVDGDYQWDILD